MYNLFTYYVADFQIEVSYTFSATEHLKGLCDGVGEFIKFTPIQH